MKKKLYTVIVLLGFTLMLACEKNDLPPSGTVYLLSFHAVVDGDEMNFKTGETGTAGWLVTEDTAALRTFSFWFADSLNPAIPLVTFTFPNYTIPFGDYNTDLDNTFQNGPKTFILPNPSGVNPWGLNAAALSLTYPNTLFPFSSAFAFQVPGSFNIDSSRNIHWYDGQDYKLVYLTFDCLLFPFDSVNPQFKVLQDGRAVVAFPRE